jgi:enoyl-[acyl-carrier protein] reductase I
LLRFNEYSFPIRLAITYLNGKAEPHVRPLAEALGSEVIVPCDVREAGQLEALFDEIEHKSDRAPAALQR